MSDWSVIWRDIKINDETARFFITAKVHLEPSLSTSLIVDVRLASKYTSLPCNNNNHYDDYWELSIPLVLYWYSKLSFTKTLHQRFLNRFYSWYTIWSFHTIYPNHCCELQNTPYVAFSRSHQWHFCSHGQDICGKL